MKKTAPYGSWNSPITATMVASAGIRLEQALPDGAAAVWTEGRPLEGGRSVLVRRTADGRLQDLIPAPWSARSRVHEYGGGAFTVADGTVWFVHYGDHHLYRAETGGEPALVCGEPGMRYADLTPDLRRGRLLAVREDHSAGGEPVNTLVAVSLDGGGSRVLVSGNDFYAAPRPSPDGSRLAWQTWHHPDMPWDATELWVAPLREDGSVGEATLVAGGPGESVCQPEWSPDGTLHFISDRTGWWNLYRWKGGKTVSLLAMEAEFCGPQWAFGQSTYGFLSPDRLLCAYTRDGIWHLGVLDAAAGRLERFDLPYTAYGGVRVDRGRAIVRAGSATEPVALIELDTATGQTTVLRNSGEQAVDPDYLTQPQPIEFPTAGGLTAHALFYPPRNGDYEAPPGERPPLIVFSHGGPTAAALPLFSLALQYWTSRGFAVVDVNYGGSTGYGRAYRERLNGNWGIVDVADCAAAARFLVTRGEADDNRLIIKGGSAGGFTTFAALTFTTVFRAGASYFGLSDLELFAEHTHKFESRYLDRLVAPWPSGRAVFRERSPIHHTDRLSCPLILLQGLDDKVVPPAQSELMADALRKKGIPVAYLAFEGEGHGFRRAENLKRCLEAELYFYSRIFGFRPADSPEPIPIENLR
jgi:dipeptidyl aminopeptidase/acylaminoacyl peptidase